MTTTLHNAQLHNSDFLAALAALPDNSVDALISDPPYATTNLAWDKKIDWPAFWAEAHRVCKETAVIVLFSAQPFTTDLINSNRKNFRYEIIWAKTQPTGFLNANRRPMTAHENILIFSQRPGSSTYNPQKVPGTPYKSRRSNEAMAAHYTQGTKRVPTVNATGERHPWTYMIVPRDNNARSLHPTQKPVPLMRHLVLSYSSKGDVVLDPFMGSGSTGVACVETGRQFIGIERDEAYFATARDRIGSVASVVR